ncbi:hypothetical protein MHU86_2184 [Fragilaria crotonensis]|nr:hypothetical protein MHU86_2184 [Fragilaria crotonensis]
MTSITLSRRAAELLGPPPESSIDWDEVIHNRPRVLVSNVPLHEHVPVERTSPQPVDADGIIATVFDEHDDEDDDEWQMNAKKRPRAKPNIRRVTLETTQRTPLGRILMEVILYLVGRCGDLRKERNK